ncbi:MAG: hypothetical protein OFPII_31790 [Osedax symbiont Rs1]|nr:MAG: hypothetical protein OFPII_31790 [Osedax symbiont Rs1]
MPLLIDGKASTDHWVFLNSERLAADVERTLTLAQQSADAVVYPLAVYFAHRERLNLDPEKTGILVKGDDDLSELASVLQEVSLIAIDFPVLRDGRGFSIARNVTRRGFKGQVRAVGDVSYDRLDHMHRSGFNAYQIADELYTEQICNAFSEITVNYQPTHLR